MPFARQFPDSASFLAPSRDYFSITPSNTVDNPYVCRSIRVGNGGDVVAVREDGVAVPFKNCYAGEVLDIVAIRVNATDTTATDLVGL